MTSTVFAAFGIPFVLSINAKDIPKLMMQDGGMAFAYSQLVYACCLLVSYWSYFTFKVCIPEEDQTWKGFKLFPQRLVSDCDVGQWLPLLFIVSFFY